MCLDLELPKISLLNMKRFQMNKKNKHCTNTIATGSVSPTSTGELFPVISCGQDEPNILKDDGKWTGLGQVLPTGHMAPRGALSAKDTVSKRLTLLVPHF